MTDPGDTRPVRHVSDVRCAALQAQGLLLAAQTLDARLSGLSSGAPAHAIKEAAMTTRAIALQIAGVLHGLVAQSERMLMVAEGADHEGDRV
jgi:hypothetical protein